MTQRGRFVAYIAFLHGVLALFGVLLWLESPFWLLAVEMALAVSAGVGIALTRRLFRESGFARAALQSLKERDFTSRFRQVGHPEVDALTRLYNEMVETLRQERTLLQEQHHFLSHVLRVSPTGLVILDFDRRVDSVNPAAGRLLGGDAVLRRGSHLDDVAPPVGPSLAALKPHSAAVMDVNGRRVRCHHGTFIDRGFPRSFILVEELTQELRDAERSAYEKLIRVMAHEVNNSIAASNSLLHSCLAYAGELSDDSRPDFEEAIRVVIDRTDELNRFMRSFAAVYRLPPPVKRAEPVRPLLERSVRLLSAAPGVRWHWDAAAGDLTVAMDRGQMEQAFLNVLQNAVDATSGSGDITIRLRRDDGRATAVIEDSGPGIAPEAEANLFTPFFSTKPHGEGIGLTLVREILRGHGFDYSLTAVPGGPTRFTVVFS